MTYRLLQWCCDLLSYIPLGAMYVLSDILFYPLYYVVRYRREVVRRNLTGCFPEMNHRQIVALERKFYRFFVDLIFETVKIATISLKKISRRVHFTNPEEIRAVLSEGRSVSLYMGHYADWEWIPSMSRFIDPEIEAAQIYRKLNNKAVDRLLIRNRERLGGKCVEMRQTARWMAALADSGKTGIIGFVADQSPRKSGAMHYVNLLGRRTPAFTGAEKITKRYGFEAWFIDIKRVKRGYYEATFVPLAEDSAALPDFELTDRYYEHLQRAILRQPELYLWSHNRFRYAEKRETL